MKICGVSSFLHQDQCTNVSIQMYKNFAAGYDTAWLKLEAKKHWVEYRTHHLRNQHWNYILNNPGWFKRYSEEMYIKRLMFSFSWPKLGDLMYLREWMHDIQHPKTQDVFYVVPLTVLYIVQY